MTNTSATGGFLAPVPSPAPLEGTALDDFIQELVVGVTGLDGKFVRPRWQAEPPNMPARNVDWSAVGVMDYKGDTFAAITHNPDDGGADTVYRQEELNVLVSFYGPNATNYASLLREGLSVPQNREVLLNNDMALISVGNLTPAPALMNERWQFRIDVSVGLRRAVRRTYPVLNILSVDGSIITDTDPQLSEPINVTP